MSVLSGRKAKDKTNQKYTTWQQAKQTSLKQVEDQLSTSNDDIPCFRNSDNPSSWIAQDWDRQKTAEAEGSTIRADSFYISWRIAGEMVHFTDEQKENQSNYIEAGSTAEEAKEVLKELKAEIEAGDWDAEIKEAFDRKQRKKAEAAAKKAAE